MAVSLRNFGYASMSPICSRQLALNTASVVHGKDAVIARLAVVTDFNTNVNIKKNMQDDMNWLTSMQIPLIDIPVMRLSSYGYSTKLSSPNRQQALKRAIAVNGKDVVIARLKYLIPLIRITQFNKKMTISDDLEWLSTLTNVVVSTSAPFSLRSFGYNTYKTDSLRHESIEKAVIHSGVDVVMKRFVEVSGFCSDIKAGDIMKNDMEWMLLSFPYECVTPNAPIIPVVTSFQLVDLVESPDVLTVPMPSTRLMCAAVRQKISEVITFIDQIEKSIHGMPDM